MGTHINKASEGRAGQVDPLLVSGVPAKHYHHLSRKKKDYLQVHSWSILNFFSPFIHIIIIPLFLHITFLVVPHVKEAFFSNFFTLYLCYKLKKSLKIKFTYPKRIRWPVDEDCHVLAHLAVVDVLWFRSWVILPLLGSVDLSQP